MTTPQLLSIAVLVAMMFMFVWGRFRCDLVAVMVLLRRPRSRNRKTRCGLSRILRRYRNHSRFGTRSQRRRATLRCDRAPHAVVAEARYAGALATASPDNQRGFASTLVKNIGALAMLMPAAFQLAQRSQTSPSVFLMPMAFASLLGGLIALIGTSPNIIVSRLWQQGIAADRDPRCRDGCNDKRPFPGGSRVLCRRGICHRDRRIAGTRGP